MTPAAEFPRITLVTPCLNQAGLVDQAIASVVDQGYPNLEYRVVDGGSHDGSADLIASFGRHLDRWVSEPDQGQYHALNKGFVDSTGEIMGFLNADDVLMPGSLFVLASIFSRFSDVEWLTGAHTAMRELGKPITVIPPARWSRAHILSDAMDRFLPQESTFWRRSLWDRAGARVDESFGLAADFELWARFSRHAAPVSVNIPLGCFRFVRGQRSVAEREGYMAEVATIREREKGLSPVDERLSDIATSMLPRLSGASRARDYLDSLLGAPLPMTYVHGREEFLLPELGRRRKVLNRFGLALGDARGALGRLRASGSSTGDAR